MKFFGKCLPVHIFVAAVSAATRSIKLHIPLDLNINRRWLSFGTNQLTGVVAN